MTSRRETKSGVVLSDTCIQMSRLPEVESSSVGRGCLLQIYPAFGSSELTWLESSRTLLGRDPACGVPVEDSSVSRLHAAIDAADDSYFLMDLNSTNGTWVENDRVSDSRQLHGGELIRLGNTILKFMLALDEEAQYYAVVHDLMTHDPLTNAFNRGYLIPFIEKELQSCRQSDRPLSLILMDIDRFKQTNDRHGHLVGDEVLRIFCERVRHLLREPDSLARYGGEEFAVVCLKTRLDEAVSVAEAIQKSMTSEPFHTQAGQLKITCSLGVTSSDGHSLPNFDALLAAADRLLYVSKAQGRNSIRSAEGCEVPPPGGNKE